MRRPAFFSSVVLVLLGALSGFAQTTYKVTLNTAAVSGKAGKIVFDYTTSTPEAGSLVTISNFTASGATIGQPSSTGGLIEGDLILGVNPAPFTTISTDYFGTGQFFTELAVNVTKFSSSITFQFSVNGSPPNPGSPPDQFAFYVLDGSGNAWFTTADPLGANALVTFDVIGISSGTLNVYAPAVAGANNAITLTLPPSTGSFTLNRSTLNFGVKTVITSAQSVLLQVPAGVAWTASSNQAYVSVQPASGTGPGTFSVNIVASALPAGNVPPATITVAAPAAPNSPQTVAVNVYYPSADVPYGSFDTPANGATGIFGAVAVTGWALDNVEIAGVDIWREKIGAEPTSPNGLVFIGTAVLVADARPDVAAASPNLPFNYRGGWGYQVLTNELPNSGSPAGLGNGAYNLHAIAHNTAGVTVDLGTHTITVNNSAASTPFGTIDTPTQGGTASGSAFVNFAWALTQNPYMIPSNGSTIAVQVDGQNIGNPVYGQNRADIASLFPGLANSNGAAGYYMLDTTKFANGVHTIAWIVYDNQNRGAGIGSRFFNILNTATPMSIDQGPLPESRGPVTLKRGYDPGREVERVPLSKHGWFVVEAEEMDRIELRVGADTGYLSANAEIGALPAGSSLNNGIFYWQLAPGFLGDYPLVFMDREGSFVSVMVKVLPKTYPVNP